MSQASLTAVAAFRSFSSGDLETLEALQSHPRASGWQFHCDRDETWDLISIQPPTGRAFPESAYRRNDAFLVTPAPEGQSGVLMAAPGRYQRPEIAYPSLSAALADVGPKKVAWRRCLG